MGEVVGAPAFLTSFVGRERELVEVTARLRQVRLLTLVGAGGVGKTRLATVVASDRAEEFADGAWFVELAPVTDAEMVPTVVLRALGVLETHARAPRDALIYSLRARHLLLVLDNCEHVLDACAHLADSLVGACRRLTVLATSRQPLGISSETVWRIPSLSTPSSPVVTTLDALGDFAAVRLFVDRAQAALAEFALTAENAAAVASICRQLDGIPLAIELAAARCTALTPAQIAERLDDRFRLLTGGSRTAPTRQQTLRATVDWSYQLLDVAERAVLRTLAVFAGGWSLDAAEVICPTSESISTFDRLAHLIAASLVQADLSGGDARYHLLETLRQYARERLEEHVETDAARRRHALFFVSLAERAAPELVGARQIEWLRRLDADHENLQTALAWCRVFRPLDGLRLALGIWPHWRLRGYLREGRAWLEVFLSAAPEGSALRARALHAAGELAMRQGDVTSAHAHLERSVELFRALDDVRGEADALERLGLTHALRGEWDDGRALIEAGLARFRALGDKRAMGWTLTSLGMLTLTEGNTAVGEACLVEAEALLRGVGDQHGLAYAVGNLGQAARARGNYSLARQRLEESLALFSAVGDRPFVGWNLANLADVLRLEGNIARARSVFGEALLLLRDVASGRHLCSTLVGCAMLEIRAGRLERGVSLSVAASCNYPALRSSLMPDELADWDAAIADARARLPDTEFAQAWTVGEALTLEQAIALALSDPPEPPRSDALGMLSPREREVARLVARGLSNREVAQQLVVAERTAEAHVTHALTKLGLRSRAQLAVWAHQHGLT